jgi:hypothetical protein
MADEEKTPTDGANSGQTEGPTKDTDDKSAGSGGSGNESGNTANGGSGSGDGSSGSDGGGSGNGAPLTSALNPQIVQAVGATNHSVLNGAEPGANGIAYQKVSQAAAYAVQDSTDYMRNIMSMASAATGVALQKMLAEKKTDPYTDIIKAATSAVNDAQQTFSKVGEAAGTVVKDFDSLA